MPGSDPAPKLIAIAAMASNRVIGRHGKLPWHLPEDLKFFQRTTLGHPVLMGRKTFESILAQLGKPLPGRLNLVLSHTLPPRDGVRILRSIADLPRALEDAAHGTPPVFLIGGAELYQTLLPRCDELLLTWVEAPHDGDVFFPPFEHLFELRERLGRGAGFEFRRYSRK